MAKPSKGIHTKGMAKIIEAEFDPRLREIFESRSLDSILVNIRSPGTRVECDFRVQVEVYEVLGEPLNYVKGDSREVRYLGYFKLDSDLRTREVPQFFLNFGEKLLEYTKK